MNSRRAINFRQRLNILCRFGHNRAHAPAACVLHGGIHLFEFGNPGIWQCPPDEQTQKTENHPAHRQSVREPPFHITILADLIDARVPIRGRGDESTIACFAVPAWAITRPNQEPNHSLTLFMLSTNICMGGASLWKRRE